MKATERARCQRSRKHSSAEPRDWDDINQRLACLGELERQIQALRDQFDQKVAVLKQQWLEASQGLEREQARLREQIEQFYWAHQDEVLATGRKSVELPFGRLGSRLSRSVEVKDPASAECWLLAHGFQRYLRTRTEVDREALRSTLLAGPGSGAGEAMTLLRCPAIRLRESEQFWCELNSEHGDARPGSANRSQVSVGGGHNGGGQAAADASRRGVLRGDAHEPVLPRAT